MVTDYWYSLSTGARVLLIMALALCGLWVAGMQPRIFDTADGLNTFILYGGRIELRHRSRVDATYSTVVGGGPNYEYFGTGGFRTYTVNGGHVDTLDFTFWPLVILCAVIPFRSYLRFRRVMERKRRIETGHCGKCGYDLHGLQCRCPECGEPIIGGAKGVGDRKDILS